MSRVRGLRNRTTELRLAALFRRNGIVNWRTQATQLPGTPDFTFRRLKMAVFVDGCFWHGCPDCYTPPKSNKKFWAEKIRRNKARDRRVSGELRSLGWAVLRIWECELRSDGPVVRKFRRVAFFATQ